MIPHTYKFASQDPAAWDADQCDRQAVTVEWAYEHLCDEPLWHYRQESADCGFDPWRLIDGIDKFTSGNEYELCGAADWFKRVGPKFRVFAQRSTLRKLGLPEGERGGLKVPTR
jgi:hypothetical protein